MPEIMRDSQAFTVYATEGTADLYALGSMDATAWSAATQETKERALITSTRILDRQQWIDTLDTFDERVANENVVNASIEIAFYLVAGSDLETNAQQTTQVVKSLRAGSVAIDYAIMFASEPQRWPLPIQEKLRGLLGGDLSGFGGAITSGTDGCSVNNNDFGLNRGY